MTSVRHWQSICISTVSATCKTTFYLSLSSIRTTIPQLAVTHKCENASSLTVCSQCLYLLFASCLTLTTALSCHWMYSWLCWSMALSFSSTFAWPKITSWPFQTVLICLYSSQFRLQHHTVKCLCNDLQWKTFTVSRVNLKKLSSEMPLNSEVQIYQCFWGICCLHLQGSFTVVLKMEVPQSSEILVITYDITHKSGITDLSTKKPRPCLTSLEIHQTVSSLKHKVSISSFSIC